MRLEDVKNKIDAYFEQTSVEEIIQGFESLGYEFESTSVLNDLVINSVSKINSLDLEDHNIDTFMSSEEIVDCFSTVNNLSKGQLLIENKIPFNERVEYLTVSFSDIELSSSEVVSLDILVLTNNDELESDNNASLEIAGNRQYVMAA